MSNDNKTKVMCPVCGSEFTIAEHEHKVENATVIGQDSGLGDVFLQVSKRGEALKACGIDTSKFFSIKLPTGDTQIMQMNDNGTASVVPDTIVQKIISYGTVPNRSLFRRWVMSQVFHGLGSGLNHFNDYIKRHGYDYTWKMLIEECRVQAKLYGKDNENYLARNRWFNKELAIEMATNYISQLSRDVNARPRHKCKGVQYVKIGGMDVFVSDINKKIIAPMLNLMCDIKNASTPDSLYRAVVIFWKNKKPGSTYYKQCSNWKDAYKGMGAYATMQNLLRFHGCVFPRNNSFYNEKVTGLEMLEDAAAEYSGEGWRLFGLMKQMLCENNIDIDAKMKEWRK